MEQIPRIVLEDTSARYTKIIRGLILVILIEFLAFAGLVAYIFGFYEVEDVSIDSKDGVANYLQAGGNGEINNGEDSSAKDEAKG